jgi:hypothetical protein
MNNTPIITTKIVVKLERLFHYILIIVYFQNENVHLIKSNYFCSIND